MSLELIKRLFVNACGSAIAVVAASVLAGYLFEFDNLTTWRGLVPMALPTAFCFLLTGAAFITIASTFGSWNSNSSSHSSP